MIIANGQYLHWDKVESVVALFQSSYKLQVLHVDLRVQLQVERPTGAVVRFPRSSAIRSMVLIDHFSHFGIKIVINAPKKSDLLQLLLADIVSAEEIEVVPGIGGGRFGFGGSGVGGANGSVAGRLGGRRSLYPTYVSRAQLFVSIHPAAQHVV